MLTYNLLLSSKRINENGQAPIYVRFCLFKKMFDRSTGIFIEPNQFERNTKRVMGKTKAADNANNKLNIICFELNQLTKRTLSKGAYLLAIKKIIDSANDHQMLDNMITVTHYYMQHLSRKIGSGLSDEIKPVSYKKNEFLSKCIINYIKESHLEETAASQFDQEEVRKFMTWCKEVKTFSLGHTNKLTKFIKSVLRYGSIEGYCAQTTALTVRLKNEVKPIVYLKQDQLSSIKKLNLCGHKLERTRDLFLFQCYTGFSYVDLGQFKKEWITGDLFGNLFIKYMRGKNGKLAIVPVQHEALELLKKYDYKLPVISNQKYNANLKLLGLLANFDFILTTHVGRKTCGSNLLNKGVGIYTVKTILGHSSVKTTEAHYAELNESGIITDMRQASGITLAKATVYSNQVEMFE